MINVRLGYGCGLKVTLLTPAGSVCDLRKVVSISAVLRLPSGETMPADDISVDKVTNAVYVRLLGDRELTKVGTYGIVFNVKLSDGVMYSTPLLDIVKVSETAEEGYQEITTTRYIVVTDLPENAERTGASPKVSTRQTWLVYNDEAKAYEDTGIPAEVNFGDYYTKEEIDEKVAELESEIVSSFFVGKGNVYIEKKLTSLIPTKQYRILINANTSATDGTSGYRFKLEAYDSANTSLGVLAYTAQGKNLKDYYDITLPSNAAYVTIGGRCGSGDLFRYTIVPILDKTNEDIYLEKAKSTNIWVDSTSKVVIEENTNYGYLYFTFSKALYVRREGSVLWSGTIADLATHLGVALETSKNGVVDCINIPSNQILAYNLESEKFSFVQRDNITITYLPIVANFSGQCVYVAQGIYNAIDALKGKDEILANIKRNTFISTYCDEDVKTKADEYCAMLNNSNIVENFIFFTDQHYGSQDGLSMDTELMQSHINIIEKYFNATPTDFVMSGGDWLNKGDTQVQACAKLGYIDGFMNAKFKKYYPILGNHDTNNQGIENEGAAAYSGVLNNETIANLWFRNWGKNYYDFQTARVHWIILDTQHDFAPKMNDYKWQQIAWLGERLKANVYTNVVIAFHIYWQQESNNEISPITDNALNMAAAFNNKTTITLNGVTYDFSQTKGMVKCAICGHSHKDFNLIHNGVPVIATDRTGTSAIPTFDLVCLDFTNKKFKSIRVGNGENRIIDIL